MIDKYPFEEKGNFWQNVWQKHAMRRKCNVLNIIVHRSWTRDFLKIKSAKSKNNIPKIVYYFSPPLWYFTTKNICIRRNFSELNKINIQYCPKYRQNFANLLQKMQYWFYLDNIFYSGTPLEKKIGKYSYYIYILNYLYKKNLKYYYYCLLQILLW